MQTLKNRFQIQFLSSSIEDLFVKLWKLIKFQFPFHSESLIKLKVFQFKIQVENFLQDVFKFVSLFEWQKKSKITSKWSLIQFFNQKLSDNDRKLLKTLVLCSPLSSKRLTMCQVILSSTFDEIYLHIFAQLSFKSQEEKCRAGKCLFTVKSGERWVESKR